MTGQRVTIVMDNDNVKWLRKRQGKMQENSENSISFSRVINDALREI